MLMSSRRPLLALSLALLMVPAALAAQDRAVVSKEVSVGRSEATLHLEFADNGKLDISFRDGSVLVDDKSVGSFQSGDALDRAWRDLLGKAVSLDDGALSDMLDSWSPPADLPADRESTAKAIDQAIRTALTPPSAPKAKSEDQAKPQKGTGSSDNQDLLRQLLGRTDHLAELAVALQDVDTDHIQVHVDEDVDIGRGETVDGTLVSVGGHVKISGTVNGDVVVVSGNLELMPSSEIEGDVRLADASIDRNGGTVSGDVVDVTANQKDLEDQIRSQVRQQVQSELRGRETTHTRHGISLFGPIRSIVHGLGGIIQDLLTIFILGLIGAAVVAFAGPNIDAVADTARRTPGRAAMVGVAGAFLLIPVWLLGMVALAVSIVGIPVMIAWIPLFPLAAVAAAILGYVAVARNTGEWLAHSELRFTDRIRVSNPIHTIVGGLVGLMAAFIAANVFSMLPFFGFLEGLLVFVGVMITIAATMIGFGAVLLTRAGTRPEYHPAEFDTDAAWEAAMEAADHASVHTRDDDVKGEGDDSSDG